MGGVGKKVLQSLVTFCPLPFVQTKSPIENTTEPPAVLGTFWKLAWTLCCYPCALAQKLSNLLVHVTEKVHIGCSPAQALVFHQEVFEQHLQLVLLFHHNKL